MTELPPILGAGLGEGESAVGGIGGCVGEIGCCFGVADATLIQLHELDGDVVGAEGGFEAVGEFAGAGGFGLGVAGIEED